MRPMPGGTPRCWRTMLGVAAGGVVLVALPLALNPYLVSVAILVLFYAYLGQCWNIVGGYAGQLSFGHAAFFGLGAYTSTALLVKAGLNPWIGMAAGGVVAAAVASFMGLICFRYKLRGPFFALTTLAFAESFRVAFVNWREMGGSVGLLVPIKGNSLLLFQFSERWAYYYVILAMLSAVSVFVSVMARSKFGYYLQAIREDESAAGTLGVNCERYKLLAVAVSAFLTALGGTFYAQYLFYIDPTLVFGVQVSVDMILRPLLGGMGTVWGPILGSVALTPLSELTRSLLRGFAGADLMLYGAILVAAIIYLPHGLAGLWRDRGGRLAATRLLPWQRASAR